MCYLREPGIIPRNHPLFMKDEGNSQSESKEDQRTSNVVPIIESGKEKIIIDILPTLTYSDGKLLSLT